MGRVEEDPNEISKINSGIGESSLKNIRYSGTMAMKLRPRHSFNS